MPFFNPFKAKESSPQGHVPTLPNLATVELWFINAIALGPQAVKGSYAGSHPVFVVDYSGGSVVVKGEGHDIPVKVKNTDYGERDVDGNGVQVPDATLDESARWAGKLMYSVCGYTKVSLVTDAEKSALKDVPYTRFSPAVHDHVACSYLHHLLDGGKHIFYKMPFVPHMHGMPSMAKDTASCTAMLKMLNKDRKVLYDLARVIAVDMFIGNYDRFRPDGTVVNPENVLFIMEGKKLTPVGVDFYDITSSSDESHTATTDSILLYSPRRDWAGTMLADPVKLNDFATKLLDGLNRYFTKALKGLGINAAEEMLIDELRVGDIAKGLLDGARGLREYLQRRFVQGKSQPEKLLPAEIRIRMERLGW